MKKYLFAALLAVSSYASATVVNNFTGDFSVDHFTTTGAHGSVDTSQAPGTVSFISADDDVGPSNLDFTTVANNNFTIAFNFHYMTVDIDGPSYDPFGFLLNGVFTQLSYDDGADNQSGSATFQVNAGDTFGFRAGATDSILGSATTAVSGFSATSVPEPASAALFGLGLLGLTAFSRKPTRIERV